MTFTDPNREATPFVVALNFPAHLGGRVRVPCNVTGLSETIGQRQVTTQRQTSGGRRTLLGEDPEMVITIDAEMIPSAAQLHYLQVLRHTTRQIALGVDRPQAIIDDSGAVTAQIAADGDITFAGDGDGPRGAFPGACIQPKTGAAAGDNYEIIKIVETANGENRALGLPAPSDLIKDNDVSVFVGMDSGDTLTAVAAVTFLVVMPATKIGSLGSNGAVTIGDVQCRVSQCPSLGTSQRGPDARVTGQIVLAAEGDYAEEVVSRGD